ncbi:MAG: aspartate/glutamate racemase family protein [Candidatus Eremiobacteraeota bacterium]|nr:aspartate/glutamate racemase family protein [Candidatus Eremiobacteraeota bacterium]
MKTLFINPNGSDEITATLRRHIERCGWPASRGEVATVERAPRIIGSAEQNAEAENELARVLPELGAGFDRVVMMSSVDTGYDIARKRFGSAAFGFTRSVLGQHHKLDQKIHVVTFDKDMTPLYEHAFEATGYRSVVAGWSVLDQKPTEVAARPEAALDALRETCTGLAKAPAPLIFVVGAVGLDLALRLRQEGLTTLIDPVSDLLAWLGRA